MAQSSNTTEPIVLPGGVRGGAPDPGMAQFSREARTPAQREATETTAGDRRMAFIRQAVAETVQRERANGTPEPDIEKAVVKYLERQRGRGMMPDSDTRRIGLFARAMMKGVTRDVGGIISLAEQAPRVAGGQPVSRVGQTIMGAGEGAADVMRIPRPETPGERVASEMVTEATGALVTSGLARLPGVARRFPRVAAALGGAPKAQALGAAAAGGIGQSLQEADQPASVQLAARLMAGGAPQMAPYVGRRLAQRVLAAGTADPAAATSRIQMMEQFGFRDVPVGAAFPGSVAQHVQGAMNIIPGASRFTKGVAQRVTRDAERAALNLAAEVTGGAVPTRETLGTVLKHAVDRSNPESWPSWFRDMSEALKTAADAQMSGSRVLPGQSVVAADEILGRIAREPVFAEAFAGHTGMISSIRQKMMEQLQWNAATGRMGIDYDAFREFRSLVGEMVDAPTTIMASSQAKGALKKLYGAMSDDIAETARAVGPDAERAVNQFNEFYKQGREKIDAWLQPISDQKTPEKLVAWLLDDTDQGATKVREIMGALRPSQQRSVAATVIHNLGRESDESSFSLSRFAEQWNRMHSTAKDHLFRRLSPTQRQDLDNLAQVITGAEQSLKPVLQATGTAGASATAQVLRDAAKLSVAPVLAALAFKAPEVALGSAAATGAMFTLGNMTSRWLASPTTARWIAQSARLPLSQFPNHVRSLERVATGTSNGEDKRAAKSLYDYLVQYYNIPESAMATGQLGPVLTETKPTK